LPPADRPPLPPFSLETAIEKVRLAEDAWNSRDPERVSLAYTVDSQWRNRAEFINGRTEIVSFFNPQMESRARLSPDQGDLGLSREPYRGAVCL
jgi:nuclear transport factor 2 (NTF2) superfamily protein